MFSKVAEYKINIEVHQYSNKPFKHMERKHSKNNSNKNPLISSIIISTKRINCHEIILSKSERFLHGKL